MEPYVCLVVSLTRIFEGFIEKNKNKTAIKVITNNMTEPLIILTSVFLKKIDLIDEYAYDKKPAWKVFINKFQHIFLNIRSNSTLTEYFFIVHFNKKSNTTSSISITITAANIPSPITKPFYFKSIETKCNCI